MRKYLVLMLLLAGGSVWAQDVVRDTVVPPATATDTIDDDEENVIGGRPQRSKNVQREPNVLGTPVYYDTIGNAIGSKRQWSEYHRPRHHFLNNLEDRYCSFFLEAQTMLGPADVAGGVSFAYLPQRWGAYGSLRAGTRDGYVSLGPVLRLSGYESNIDWHLYGGLLFATRSVGAEAGLRIALPRRSTGFCWTSASMGLATVRGDVYLTAGISFDIVALSALSLLFLW